MLRYRIQNFAKIVHPRFRAAGRVGKCLTRREYGKTRMADCAGICQHDNDQVAQGGFIEGFATNSPADMG
jgi:hypothetical protein